MPKIFIDYRPAEVVSNKETYVEYYVLNPYTGVLVRKRIRCNRVHGKSERMKYARMLCQTVNSKLFDGWNPFFDDMPNGAVCIDEAIESFLRDKSRTSRESTLKSYRSFSKMFIDWLSGHGMRNSFCAAIDKLLLCKYLSWCDATKTLTNRSYNNYCMFLCTLFDYFDKKGFTYLPTETHTRTDQR